MSTSTVQIGSSATLRLLAEAALADEAVPAPPRPDTLQRTAHELRVYQIELEMQNQHLRRSQVDLQASQARYIALFDQAPVGYLSLGPTGAIEEANLAACALLGLTRERLVRRFLSDFVIADDQDGLYLLRKNSTPHLLPQVAELRMVTADGVPFTAQLTSTTATGSDRKPVLRLVINDISERKRAERERQALAERIDALTRHLVLMQEQARRRLSRELHDRTSANLTALRLNLDLIIAATAGARDAPDLLDRIEDTRALIEDTNYGIRDICAELHTPALDRGGLLEVVQSYAQHFTRRTGLPVAVDCAHANLRLAPFLEMSLFRIVQEALTNCAKHACASTIRITMALDRHPLWVAVEDDGSGFDTEVDRPAVPWHSGGQGLQNMKETAEFMGARLLVHSAPGKGCRIEVEL
jgi:PAS domain S-box-containing protein